MSRTRIKTTRLEWEICGYFMIGAAISVVLLEVVEHVGGAVSERLSYVDGETLWWSYLIHYLTRCYAPTRWQLVGTVFA